MPLARKWLAWTTFPFLFWSPMAFSQCEVETSSLTFGMYESRRDSDSAATVMVRCTIGIPYRIELSRGNGNFRARRLRSDAGEELIYNLFTNPTHSQIWGDGSAGTQLVGGVGTGGVHVLNIFGRIPRGQRARPGQYTDNVAVTIRF